VFWYVNAIEHNPNKFSLVAFRNIHTVNIHFAVTDIYTALGHNCLQYVVMATYMLGAYTLHVDTVAELVSKVGNDISIERVVGRLLANGLNKVLLMESKHALEHVPIVVARSFMPIFLDIAEHNKTLTDIVPVAVVVVENVKDIFADNIILNYAVKVFSIYYTFAHELFTVTALERGYGTTLETVRKKIIGTVQLLVEVPNQILIVQMLKNFAADVVEKSRYVNYLIPKYVQCNFHDRAHELLKIHKLRKIFDLVHVMFVANVVNNDESNEKPLSEIKVVGTHLDQTYKLVCDLDAVADSFALQDIHKALFDVKVSVRELVLAATLDTIRSRDDALCLFSVQIFVLNEELF